MLKKLTTFQMLTAALVVVGLIPLIVSAGLAADPAAFVLGLVILLVAAWLSGRRMG